MVSDLEKHTSVCYSGQSFYFFLKQRIAVAVQTTSFRRLFPLHSRTDKSHCSEMDIFNWKSLYLSSPRLWPSGVSRCEPIRYYFDSHDIFFLRVNSSSPGPLANFSPDSSPLHRHFCLVSFLKTSTQHPCLIFFCQYLSFLKTSVYKPPPFIFLWHSLFLAYLS